MNIKINSYILLVAIGYFIAILVLIFNYKKMNPKWLRLFIIFIPFEFCLQILATNRHFFILGSNHYIVNIQSFTSSLFYIFIFSKAIAEKKWIHIILAFAASIVLIFLIEAVFIKKSLCIYLEFSDTSARIIVFIICLLYLFYLLSRDELINYFKVPMFWITTGIIVAIIGVWGYSFWSGSQSIKKHSNSQTLAYSLLILTNNFQYILFAVGFICNRKWKKVK